MPPTVAATTAPTTAPAPVNGEIPDRDVLFPSEQWFYYWKTSASLWESQLASSGIPSTINIPVNWGLHCEDGEFVDFGENRPETDLARLAEICDSLHREVLFFLALGPLPIFAHGGVPRLLARLPARDMAGIAHVYMDLDGRINQLYSFFDQRIFVAFQKYVRQLAEHFSQRGVVASVVGLSGGSMEQRQRETFVNYFEDTSRAFDRGFHRFISKNSTEHRQANFNRADEEWEARHLYQQMTQELYRETARELLGDYWMGSLDFSFLGGGPRDIFKRIHSGREHPREYIPALTLSLTHDKIPSAALLSGASRTPGLLKFLSKVVTPAMIKSRLEQGAEASDGECHYASLRFFEIHERPPRYSRHARSWRDTGLRQYLERAYSGTYKMSGHPGGFWPSAYSTEWAHGVFGAEMDEAAFRGVLRAFLDGASFVLDLADMPVAMARRLECFMLENSLEVEEVKYRTEIRRVVLGDGQLLLFDGKPLQREKRSIQDAFWEKLLSMFEFSRQDFALDEGVVAVWKKRPPMQGELSFAEIRSAILYNPTEHKKRATISPQKKFKLLRYSDEYRVKVAGLQGGVEAVLSGDGLVAIDFGFVE